MNTYHIVLGIFTIAWISLNVWGWYEVLSCVNWKYYKEKKKNEK